MQGIAGRQLDQQSGTNIPIAPIEEINWPARGDLHTLLNKLGERPNIGASNAIAMKVKPTKDRGMRYVFKRIKNRAKLERRICW